MSYEVILYSIFCDSIPIREFCVSDIRTVLMVRLGFQPSARSIASSSLWLASTSFPRLRLGEVSPWSRRLHSSSSSFAPLCSLFVSLTQKERRKKNHVPCPP